MENYKEEHLNLIANSLEDISQLLLVKGQEYVRGDNPLHNFDAAARKANNHPAEALQGMLLKHDVSIDDLVQDMKEGKTISMTQVKEKIHDRLVYNLLLLSIFNRYINN